MAKIRSNEFVKFVETGKRARFGELLFVGDEVYSYDTKIAIVDRSRKEVYFNPEKYSKTTSCHQKAVEVGTALLASGWKLVYLNPEFAVC